MCEDGTIRTNRTGLRAMGRGCVSAADDPYCARKYLEGFATLFLRSNNCYCGKLCSVGCGKRIWILCCARHQPSSAGGAASSLSGGAHSAYRKALI